jgi:hypothetical protein
VAAVFVEIDGIGADECGAIVIDLADFAGFDNLESSADRVPGPIGGGAVDGAIAIEEPAAGVMAAAGLGGIVGGGADSVSDAARDAIGNF